MGLGSWLFGSNPAEDIQTSPMSSNYVKGELRGTIDNQAPQLDQSQANQTRGQQGQLSQMLFNTAQGATPGAGELAVNRQIGQAQAAQAAQAATARGANAGLANRQAARTGAEIGVTGAGQAAQAQMQDQQGAQNQLAGLLGTQRQQDLSAAGQNAQMIQQQQQIKMNALAQYLGVDQVAIQNALARAGVMANPDRGMIGGLATGIGAALAGAAAGG